MTNERARLRNKAVRSECRTRVRELESAVESGDADEIAEAARNAQSAVGVAGRKGVFAKNVVARKQRQIAKLAES